MLKGIDVIELKILKREISRARQFGEGRHRAQWAAFRQFPFIVPTGVYEGWRSPLCKPGSRLRWGTQPVLGVLQ